MRMHRSLLAVAVLIAIASTARAHGEGSHLMGTVKSVREKSITVTAPDGDDVVVAIDDKTKIESAGKPATLKDVTVGARVVVHTKKTDAGLVAAAIKLGKAAATQHDDQQEHPHEHQAK